MKSMIIRIMVISMVCNSIVHQVDAGNFASRAAQRYAASRMGQSFAAARHRWTTSRLNRLLFGPKPAQPIYEEPINFQYSNAPRSIRQEGTTSSGDLINRIKAHEITVNKPWLSGRGLLKPKGGARRLGNVTQKSFVGDDQIFTFTSRKNPRTDRPELWLTTEVKK